MRRKIAEVVLCAIFISISVPICTGSEENKAANEQTESSSEEATILPEETVLVQTEQDIINTEEETIVEEVETTTLEEIVVSNRISLSDYDYNLMARVVMTEAGGESFNCQLAVAETIVNRILSDDFPNTVEDVIRGQYSTHYNGEPTDSVYEAIQTACEIQTYPSNMYYFRDDYYHDFGVPYMEVDNMYFSLKE